LCRKPARRPKAFRGGGKSLHCSEMGEVEFRAIEHAHRETCDVNNGSTPWKQVGGSQIRGGHKCKKKYLNKSRSEAESMRDASLSVSRGKN